MGFHGPSGSTVGKCYLRAKCGQICCRHSVGYQIHLLICKESQCSERTMKSTEFLHQSLPWLFISLWHVTINLRAIDSNNFLEGLLFSQGQELGKALAGCCLASDSCSYTGPHLDCLVARRPQSTQDSCVTPGNLDNKHCSGHGEIVWMKL